MTKINDLNVVKKVKVTRRSRKLSRKKGLGRPQAVHSGPTGPTGPTETHKTVYVPVYMPGAPEPRPAKSRFALEVFFGAILSHQLESYWPGFKVFVEKVVELSGLAPASATITQLIYHGIVCALPTTFLAIMRKINK
ncbi:TPA: hypothetical protein LUX64_003569 [Enterobacter hormaechei]|nr:hypothetical protein [Enterobacter hormaechei]HBM2647497.1 hypothetical protein [Enterobacter hormaechei]